MLDLSTTLGAPVPFVSRPLRTQMFRQPEIGFREANPELASSLRKHHEIFQQAHQSIWRLEEFYR